MKNNSLALLAALLLCTSGLLAQSVPDSFPTQWKLIDSLLWKSSLPKSALDQVNKLYQKASTQKNEPQAIKTLVYRLYITRQIQDVSDSAQLKNIEREIDKAFSVPQKSILRVLLAKNYNNILDNNSWQIRNRTNTSVKPGDVETWTNRDFLTTIDSIYQAALAPAATLQQTSLSGFEAIIVKGNARYLRPTLYDLLANDAIEYYAAHFNTQPNNSQISNEQATALLAPAEAFIQYRFTISESYATQQLIQGYQKLLQFHKQDAKPDAFIDADINRISWAYANCRHPKKDSLYLQTLKQLINKYEDNPVAAQAIYLHASFYASRAATYQPLSDTQYRYDYITAKSIIDKALSHQKAPSEGSSNMQQLLKSIQTPALTNQVERINLPAQPFRAYIRYRNTPMLYGKIFRFGALNDSIPGTISYDTTLYQFIAKQTPFRQFSQPLPVTNDYQQHSTEIKIDGLPAGRYLLVTSGNSQFTKDNGTVGIQIFTVSAISYLQYGADYFVLNRETGQPISNAKASFTKNEWNSRLRKYIKSKPVIVTTDKNGHFTFASSDYQLALYTSNDTLLTQDNIYYSNPTNHDFKSVQISFFTDRSIYRPGQTAYFKGIAYQSSQQNRKPELYTSKDSLHIFLYTPNGSLTDSLWVSTNEYGSFKGQFTFPQGLLTGRYNIQVANNNNKGINTYGSTDVMVEEYKRPKFYLAFDTLAGSYRLNDSVTVTGRATNYTGATVSGGKATYTITRNTYFPYPWLFKTTRMPYSNPQVVASGTVTTKDDGSFVIKFAAQPDSSVQAGNKPQFNFNVDVSVTDISGETRQGNTQLSVGYQSLVVKIQLPSVTESKAFTHIPVQVQNLAGKEVSSRVQITLSPLEAPSRLIRERYWNAPDQFVMTKEEYISLFPHDEYGEETNHLNWNKKAAIINTTYNTSSTDAEDKGFALPSNLQAGWYVVEASVVEHGDTLKDIGYVQVFENNKNLPVTAYLWHYNDKTSVTPGNTLELKTGSSASNVYVIENVLRGDSKAGSFAYYQLQNGIKTTSIPVTEADRGGISVSRAFVIHNRVYEMRDDITVPYDNKLLKVSYKTFRNKTEPGSKETWSVQVSGSNGTKAAAELLTAMYDASLDQFNPHNWFSPAIWPSYYNPYYWSHGQGFSTNTSHIPARGYYENDQEYFSKIYDQLVDAYSLGLVSQTENNWTSSGRPRQLYERTAAPVSAAAAAEEKIAIRGMASAKKASAPLVMIDGQPGSMSDVSANAIGYVNILKNESATALYGSRGADGVVIITTKKGNEQPVQTRKNFNETAFFFPQLYADTSGTYTFSFEMPESLTQWRWLSLAHTKDLSFGTQTQTIVSQKAMMAQLNAPRFLRQGDEATLTATISNLDSVALDGNIQLELIDGVTLQPVNDQLGNKNATQSFTVKPRVNTAISFPVTVPANFSHPLTWRITARANQYSDGEENTLPVLSNRMLVTETLPLLLKGNTTKQYKLDKLVNNTSTTLSTESVTVEYTSNPIWQAVQALPYLAEYPHECAEQTFNRFYANALAAQIVNKHPQIKTAFELWKNDSSFTTGKLAQNESLKQILLEETPWVLQAESEAQQRKNIALLFDVVKMSNSAESALQKLEQQQLPEGSFSWFKGGNADRYITTYVVTGIGKLLKANAIPAAYKTRLLAVAANAITWMDEKVEADYKSFTRINSKNKVFLANHLIQNLYARSYFTGTKIKSGKATELLWAEARKYWNKQNNYNKALLAVSLARNGQKQFAVNSILPSILENAVEDSTKGMYWKDRVTCFWYTAPIEHQATMMMATAELSNNFSDKSLTDAYDNMRTWLLLNKQTNHWGTTVATADACYALLLKADQLQSSRQVTIQLGNKQISSADNATQAGSGYFKQRIDGAAVTPDMGNVTVNTRSVIDPTNKTAVSYGAVYWQYFENTDKITAATGNPLAVTKKWFIEKTTGNNKELVALTSSSEVKVGDKLVVQLIVSSDRDMEYVHVKDMRAATMEPVNVLSGYKWQDALGYYEATKDASTNFFIDNLRKGTYILSYPVFITNTGTFNAGIATAQCMYAPEFTSHSEGFKLTVK